MIRYQLRLSDNGNYVVFYMKISQFILNGISCGFRRNGGSSMNEDIYVINYDGV